MIEKMIIARAGCGKTTSLVREYLNLSQSYSNVYALTHTIMGVKVLLSRIKDKTQKPYGKLKNNIRTLHSLAISLIDDKYKIIGNMIISKRYITPAILKKHLKEEYNIEWDKKMYQEYMIMKYDNRVVLSQSKLLFFQAIDSIKRKYNYLHLEDVFTIELAKKLESDYVLIDEAQDITYEEYDFLKRAFGNTRFIFVGDSAQTIFEYIGASSSYFRQIENAAKEVDYITASYRCPKKVCQLASSVISLLDDETNTDFCANRDIEGTIKLQLFDQTMDFLEDKMDEIELENSETKKIYVLSFTKYSSWKIEAFFLEQGLPFWTHEEGEIKFCIDSILRKLTDFNQSRAFGAPEKTKKQRKNKKEYNILNDCSSFRDLGVLNEKELSIFERYNKKYSFSELKRLNKIKKPPIVITTYHKSKGDEADTVVLNCHLDDFLDPTQDIDAFLRVLYVGITRTRNELVIFAENEEEKYFKLIKKLLNY